MCRASQHTVHSPSVTMEKKKCHPWRIVARKKTCSCRQYLQYALVFALFIPTLTACRCAAPSAKPEIEILFIFQTSLLPVAFSTPGGVPGQRMKGHIHGVFSLARTVPPDARTASGET